MDSFEFFSDTEFNAKFKGLKTSGVYIIEQEIFTISTKVPVYKVGYARKSLYNRISNYRTAYGLVPFKIHALYLVPEKVIGSPPNYANLTERVIQETARKYGEYAGIGEWFKNLPLLLNILLAVRDKHKELHKNKKINLDKWGFYTFQKISKSIKKIDLVDEKTISSSFKGITVGKHTRSGDNELETLDSEEYELVALGDKNQVVKQKKPKELIIPTSYFDEDGKEIKF